MKITRDTVKRMLEENGFSLVGSNGYPSYDTIWLGNDKTGEFYEVPIPPLDAMLIFNLDASYEHYVKQWVVRSSDVQD